MLCRKPANPIFVESGRRGARARWGEPRVIRMDQLRPEEADVVRALLRLKAAREVDTPVVSETLTEVSGLEVSRGSADLD